MEGERDRGACSCWCRGRLPVMTSKPFLKTVSGLATLFKMSSTNKIKKKNKKKHVVTEWLVEAVDQKFIIPHQ